MSWFDGAWKYRAAISVNNIGGAAGGINVRCPIPKDWDAFWQNIQTDAEDIRITDASGFTEIPTTAIELEGFVFATRTLTIEFDDTPASGLGVKADSVNTYWLYWGNAAAVATFSGAIGPFTSNGTIELGVPVVPVVQALPQLARDTKPRDKVSKTVEQVTDVWFDFGPVLQRRVSSSQSSHRFEEVWAVETRIVEGSASVAVTEASNQILHPNYVKARITGGSSGENRTLECKAFTSRGRTLVGYCEINVRDVLA